MSFKFLSGDFVAEYNRVFNSFKEKQELLDEEYGTLISEIVKNESRRLEDSVPVEFPVGTKVANSYGNVGEIIGTKINLNVVNNSMTDLDEPSVGPNRYWPVKDSKDESILTLDGDLRVYIVKFDSDELSKDWGISEEIYEMYPEEFNVI